MFVDISHMPIFINSFPQPFENFIKIKWEVFKHTHLDHCRPNPMCPKPKDHPDPMWHGASFDEHCLGQHFPTRQLCLNYFDYISIIMLWGLLSTIKICRKNLPIVRFFGAKAPADFREDGTAAPSFLSPMSLCERLFPTTSLRRPPDVSSPIISTSAA